MKGFEVSVEKEKLLVDRTRNTEAAPKDECKCRRRLKACLHLFSKDFNERDFCSKLVLLVFSFSPFSQSPSLG